MRDGKFGEDVDKYSMVTSQEMYDDLVTTKVK